jgi:hypothetical protein
MTDLMQDLRTCLDETTAPLTWDGERTRSAVRRGRRRRQVHAVAVLLPVLAFGAALSLHDGTAPSSTLEIAATPTAPAQGVTEVDGVAFTARDGWRAFAVGSTTAYADGSRRTEARLAPASVASPVADGRGTVNVTVIRGPQARATVSGKTIYAPFTDAQRHVGSLRLNHVRVGPDVVLAVMVLDLDEDPLSFVTSPRDTRA